MSRANGSDPQGDVPDNDENVETRSGWRKSEITAALVHLYYMRGNSFDPTNLPRSFIAQILGTTRQVIYGSIVDAQNSIDLAVEMQKRLGEYDKEQERKRQERDVRREKARQINNEKKRERRRVQRELEFNSPRANAKRRVKPTVFAGTRPNKSALRALRAVSAGGKFG